MNVTFLAKMAPPVSSQPQAPVFPTAPLKLTVTTQSKPDFDKLKQPDMDNQIIWCNPNMPCPVCHTNKACYDTIGKAFHPCADCGEQGYKLVKNKSKRIKSCWIGAFL